MKNLIGKKVRGFKFDSYDYPHLGYNEGMSDYINQIGVIVDFNGRTTEVQFTDGRTWSYPSDLIEQHLVEEESQIALTESTDTYTDAIKEAIIKAYFNGTNLPQIKESIKQAYTAIEAGVNAQLVEIKEEGGNYESRNSCC